MWTDGAHNAVTNFALNSELEGDKCCVKAGGRGWRGEKCGESVIVTVLCTAALPCIVPFQMEFSMECVNTAWISHVSSRSHVS